MAHISTLGSGLQDRVPGIDPADEWQALVSQQASILTAYIARLQTTTTTLRQQQALVVEAEGVLTAQAQQHIALERELVALRTLLKEVSPQPAALTTRVQTLERVLAVFHGNLTTARQALSATLPSKP